MCGGHRQALHLHPAFFLKWHLAFLLLSDASSLGILNSSHKFWVPAALTWVKSGASLTEAGSCLGRSVLSQFPVLEFHSWPLGAPGLVESCCRDVPLWKRPKCCTLGPKQASPGFVSIQNKEDTLGVCLHGSCRGPRPSVPDWLAADGRMVQNHNRVVALPVAGIDPGAWWPPWVSIVESFALREKGRKMSHFYFKNSLFFFFFAAVSAEKWLYPVFMLEICSLWHFPLSLKQSATNSRGEFVVGSPKGLVCAIWMRSGHVKQQWILWVCGWSLIIWCWPFAVGVQRTETQPGLLVRLSGNPPASTRFSAAPHSHPLANSCSSWSYASLIIHRVRRPHLWCEVRSWLPPRPHMLLKKTVVLSFSSLPEMILPGITSTLGMLKVSPSPASSSSQPLGLWLVPCSVLWLPVLGFWKVALFLFGISFACVSLAVALPPTLPWLFPKFQACPSPYSGPWVYPLSSLSCCSSGLGHPLPRRVFRACSPSRHGGWDADPTRGACLLEFVVQGGRETATQFTAALSGSRPEQGGVLWLLWESMGGTWPGLTWGMSPKTHSPLGPWTLSWTSVSLG